MHQGTLHPQVVACSAISFLMPKPKNWRFARYSLSGLNRWLAASDMTQMQAAKVLGVTQARISDIERGKINQFSLDLLVRLAARAGLHPKMRLAA